MAKSPNTLHYIDVVKYEDEYAEGCYMTLWDGNPHHDDSGNTGKVVQFIRSLMNADSSHINVVDSSSGKIFQTIELRKECGLVEVFIYDENEERVEDVPNDGVVVEMADGRWAVI